MEKMNRLNHQERILLMDASLKSIDPNTIDFEEGGRHKLRMSVFQILKKCASRDRNEQLMNDEAYFVNSKGQLLIVLFDSKHNPFVVLPFEPNDFFSVSECDFNSMMQSDIG